MVLIKRSPQEIADFFNTDVYALKGDSGYAIVNYKGVSVLGCGVVDSNPHLDYNQGKVYHPNGSWLDKIKNRGMNNIFMKMTRDLIEKYSTSGETGFCRGEQHIRDQESGIRDNEKDFPQ